MNDAGKLAAFVREAMREGALAGVNHPFAEAARQFTAEVDVLGKTTAAAWFAADEKRAELVNTVFEAYHAEDEAEAVEEAVETAPAADGVLEALADIQAQLKALREAEAEQPEQEPEEEAEADEEEEAAEDADAEEPDEAE